MADEPVSAWREPWTRRAAAVGAAEPDGGHRRWRRRCWWRWPARPPCSPCRRRPTAGSSRPTPNWRSPTARHEGQRRSEGGQRAREAAVRPGDGGDQAVPRRGQRRPVLKDDQFKPLRTSCCKGRPTSTASSKACSRIRPTGPRACDGQCVLRARRADREDRRPARGAGGPPQGAGGPSGAGLGCRRRRRGPARRGQEPARGRSR